jgi:hypothetical protein
MPGLIQKSPSNPSFARASMTSGQPIGAQARKLSDNDVVQLAGVKMGFFAS